MSWSRFLEWFVLTTSIFNTITLLWLGILVWLRGDKRSGGTWLVSMGMIVGGILFISHTAIIGQGIGKTSFGMNFWWWVSWLPAVLAPTSWFLSIYWYSDVNKTSAKAAKLGLSMVVFLAVLIFWALFFINPIPTYSNVAGNEIIPTPGIAGMPVLIAAYLIYVVLCFLFPLHLLNGISGAPGEFLFEPRLKARPWLAGASLCFFAFSMVLASAAIWAVFREPLPTLRNSSDVLTVMLYDMVACISVAVGIILMGRAIVAYEAFTGRPLPRVGFFQHWRSTVLIAGGLGALIAGLVIIEVRSLYSLILVTLLMTGLYALFSWREFTERDTFMSHLRPYVENLNLYPQLIDTNPPDYQKIQDFFAALCQDVLGIRQAVLVPTGSSAAITGAKLTYQLALPKFQSEIDAIMNRAISEERFSRGEVLHINSNVITLGIPLHEDAGLVGVILCGKKIKPNPFTMEEIEIAKAGGERILDMMAALALSEMTFDLLRDRLVHTHLVEGKGRHILHDDILPELHSAIISLSALNRDDVKAAIGNLSTIHRKISDLLHDVLPAPPAYLQKDGLSNVLKEMVNAEFQDVFSTVTWEWMGEVDAVMRDLPPYVVETIFFALRELIRNAALHASGFHLGVGLWIKAGIKRDVLFAVSDNGIGLLQGGAGNLENSGTGLKFHSAMLAVIGASLMVNEKPEGGVECKIVLPEAAISRWMATQNGGLGYGNRYS